MTGNFRSLLRGTILAGVFLAVTLLAVPAAHAVKANELVIINSATIDPPLKAGGSSTLKIAATVIPDWHINSDKPFSEDYIPTKLEVSGPVSVTPGAIKYPPAETMTLDPAAGGDKIAVFGGDLKFEVPLKAAADFAPKPGDELRVTIDYQGCNNNECLRPASVSTTVALAAPGAAAGAIEGVAAGGAKSGGIGGGDDLGRRNRAYLSQSRMAARLPRGISWRPRAESDAVRLSADRRDDRLLRQPGRHSSPRDVPRDGFRARNRADVLVGGRRGRDVGRTIRRRDAKSVRARRAGNRARWRWRRRALACSFCSRRSGCCSARARRIPATRARC